MQIETVLLNALEAAHGEGRIAECTAFHGWTCLGPHSSDSVYLIRTERQTVAIGFWFFLEDAELRVKEHLLRQGANEHAGVSLVIDSGGGCCQLLNNAILLDLPHCFEADFHILLSFKAYGLATSVHRGQGYKNGYIMGK